MKNYVFVLLVSAALLPALPAYAQDVPVAPAPTRGNPDSSEITVVADGVPEATADSGRAITVLDRATIEQRQTVVLSDLLATTPGVDVSRNGGVGGYTAVRIRGAEDVQTLVLIDGVRVTDPSSPSGGFDFGNLLAGAIDRVEVLRGPDSVVWGSDAIGGVVNVTTMESHDGFHARANAEYGSYNTVSASAALSGGNDSVTGALTGGYYRTDGVSAAAIGTEPDGYRQYGATGRLKVEFAPGLSVDLRGYYSESRADIDGFPPPTFSVFADTDEYSITRELNGYAGLNADLFDGIFHNRVAVSIADIHRPTFDPSTGSAPEFFDNGNSVRYEYQGDLKPAKWIRAVFGAEHEDSRYVDGSVPPPPSAGITSGYGELIVNPLDTITFTGGVRYDEHRTFGGHTSFAASAAWHPFDGTTLRANYNEGFKAPTLFQLFSSFGDKDLRPEVSKSYEVGGEQRLFDGRVRVGASWFHRDTTDQIDFDLVRFTYFNIDATRTEGVELELSAQPVHALTLSANYTHLRAENLSPGDIGNDLARRPRDIGSASIDYAFGFGLKLGATLLVVGHSFDDAANTDRLNGYTLVSIRAEMPVTKNIALYARIENLGDEKYQTVAGYGTLGRAAYGGVRLRFN